MKLLVFTFVFLFFQITCLGQSLNDLKKKKENAAKEIQFTSKLLQETQKNEKTSLNRLRLINNKISQRNLLISNISDEINLYQEFIDDNNLVINILSEDVIKIKDEYAKLIRSAYKNKNANDKIMFLLSAENFNQAHRRILYTKRYTEYRKNQVELLQVVQKVIEDKIVKLKSQKQIKETLIGQNKQENLLLVNEKGQQNKEVQSLQREKRKLQQKLNQQRKVEGQLESAIQKIIEEEARKSRAEGGSGFALTPEQKLIGNNFEQNKRRLPWPVERGVIVERFGIHRHPVLKNVQIKNNGINIATEVGAKVRSVFNGEVSKVFGITGGNTAVIIRHGTFLSVYSNLREVVVNQGDMVAAKQNIGTVYTDSDDGNKTILKFQIWRESQKLNPEDWIGR